MTVGAQTKSPLRLHWWRAKPNFGDAISPLVVAHLSGREVQHVRPEYADMIALGSLLQVVRRTFDAPRDADRPVVWGTGLLGPVRGLRFLDNVDIALVRGPITAALLKLETVQFGDPGLLVNEVIARKGPRGPRVGIVPHHSLINDPALVALLASDPTYLLIDPTDPAPKVCAAIAGCAHVFASSLHGLITADAYGVANSWIAPDGQSRLKYLDYAAAVGRAMAAPVTLEAVPHLDLPDPDLGLPYQAGIDACRAALRASFPARLRAAGKS